MLARYSFRLSSSDEDVVTLFQASLGSDAFSIAIIITSSSSSFSNVNARLLRSLGLYSCSCCLRVLLVSLAVSHNWSLSLEMLVATRSTFFTVYA